MQPARVASPSGFLTSAATGLYVGLTEGRGRGVFAGRPLPAGALLESAPVIVVPRTHIASLRGTVLDDYLFWWDEQHNALALGCGSLFNHACPANARFECDLDARLVRFFAVRDLAAGEEVTINYHGDPYDPAPVWFETA